MMMKKLIIMFLITLMASGCGNAARETANVPMNNNNIQNSISMNQIRNIQIQIGSRIFQATLEDNPAVEEFLKKLPLEIELLELNGNEKYYRFNERFPTNDTNPDIIRTGDLMLYSGSYFVLFYKDFATSYSYTSLGKIENPAGLADAVGSGNIKIIISN